MLSPSTIDEQTLKTIGDPRPGISDHPCPLCGPFAKAPSNRTRKVLRVWNNDGFITYKCARCGASGCATGDKPRPATPIVPKDNSDRRRLADRLWGMSHPIGHASTQTETYLRMRKCYLPTMAIRHLPACNGYPPTMVTKFKGVSAVHLTRLRSDGMGKAGTDHDKLIKGPCSGFPIVIQSMEWSKPLLICEGIEDGLSLAIAFPEWTIWVAGSSSHLHKLVASTDRQVVVVVDFDMAGIKAAKRCLSINPDTVILRFPRGLDPNAFLVQYGLNDLRKFVTRHQPFHR